MNTIINILAVLVSSFIFTACVVDFGDVSLQSKTHITDSKIVEELDLQSRIMELGMIGDAVHSDQDTQKIDGFVIKMVASPQYSKRNPYVYILCREVLVYGADRSSSKYFWIKMKSEEVKERNIALQSIVKVEQSMDADPFVPHRDYFLFYSPSRIEVAAK